MKSILTYEGPRQLRANQRFWAKLHVRPGVNVRPGGRIVVAVRHVSDFGDAQTDNSDAENYIEILGPERTEWQLLAPNDWQRHPWNRGIDLRLAAGRVPAGERITICLGGVNEKGPGYRCQSFAETCFRFRLGVDPAGSGDWQVIPVRESPGLEVTGAEAARVVVTVPNATDHGMRIVCVKPEDAYGNVAGVAEGSVTLLLDDSSILARVPLRGSRPTLATVELPDDGGWHVITAASDDGRLFGRSNSVGPSLVEGHRLYWGEIHSQSALCDGTNSPEELYGYARDAAGLDFASVSSHDFQLTPDDWQQIQDATSRANEPGRFVTFLGYEWSGPYERGGDNNIYFLGDEGPLLYCNPVGGYSAWDPAEGAVKQAQTLRDVMCELAGVDAMVVPHCGGRRCNFDFYDANVMPLFEIHSCHRNFEHVAFEAIRRGLRFGFIGGSDDHRGALGDSHPAARERFFSTHSGLVAAYAKGLTREALWESFFARRTYATNGPRIALDFRVNGVLMGGELRVRSGQQLHVRFRTRLDGFLDRVELVRDTETVQRFVGAGNQHVGFEGEFVDAAQEGSTLYYVRVLQTDGGVAWSSPVWVEGVPAH